MEKTCGSCNITKNVEEYRLVKETRKNRGQFEYRCSKCKQCERSAALERYNLKREECIQKNKEYKANNPDKINKRRRQYTREKMKDPVERVKRNMKSLLCAKIKKSRHTGEYLGTSIPQIVSWLEWNMDETMSWENYGSYWEIDHTLAIKQFDVDKDDEALMCFSWMNLLPLPKLINTKKSGNLNLFRIWHLERQLKLYARKNPDLSSEITDYIDKYSRKIHSIYMRHT